MLNNTIGSFENPLNLVNNKVKFYYESDKTYIFIGRMPKKLLSALLDFAYHNDLQESDEIITINKRKDPFGTDCISFTVSDLKKTYKNTYLY